MRLRDILNEFVVIQRDLLTALFRALPKDCRPVQLRDCAPSNITVDSDAWTVHVHGVGVRFCNPKTGVVVDAHEGLWSEKDPFDVWRLTSFVRSNAQYGGRLSHLSNLHLEQWISRELHQLEKEGRIVVDENIPNHFCINPEAE